MDSLVPLIKKYLIGCLSFVVLLGIPLIMCLNSQLIMFGIVKKSSEVIPPNWITNSASGWIYILLGSTAIGVILDLIKAYRFIGKLGLLRGSGLSEDNLTSIILDSYGLKATTDIDNRTKTEWARILVDVYTRAWHSGLYVRIQNARDSVDIFSSTLFACLGYCCLFAISWIIFLLLWTFGLGNPKAFPNGIVIYMLLWLIYVCVLYFGRDKLVGGYYRANGILCEGLISALYNDCKEGKIERLYLCMTELTKRVSKIKPFERDKHIDHERVREITSWQIGN